MYSDLNTVLKKYGQEHLLAFIDDLSSEERNVLVSQIQEIDFDEIEELIEKYVLRKPDLKVPENISPAPYFPEVPESEEQIKLYADAERIGKELLGDGKIAALTVAGGQGSRLGFDGPKGSFPLTPIKNKTLFQYFAESLIRAGEKFGSPVRWYIMTSAVNDQETRAFFEKNNYFGLACEDIFFFIQGTMPAIGVDGKLLLSGKGSLALAPNGHGGTLLALYRSGALEDMRQNGIEHISYFQVDNPLVSVVNPLFIGLHVLEESEISARALIKTGPLEKLGNFCVVDDRLEIIEYSDMPDELARETDADGNLKFRAGSPAIHILSREFVERLTAGGRLQLPWHRADKKVPYIDKAGDLITPAEINGVKLETFIFDAIPMAERTMILEAAREKEFAPVKNKSGVDSAETSRAMLIARDAGWLECAGVTIPKRGDGVPDCVIELSPATFFDIEDTKRVFAGRETHISHGEKVYYE
jgi:UDP-N-acetylglucosamine/UDP-N-acetylgalactosamine diphosphorylase